MASGSFEFGASGYLQGKIDWSSSSNGASANSSNVTAILYARRTNNYTTTGKSWSGYVKVGGAQTNISFSSSVSVSTGWVEMARVSTTIGHNSDGTGSVNVSGSVTGPSGTTLAGNTSSGNQTVTLDTIPRYANLTSLSVQSRTCNSITFKFTTDRSASLYARNDTDGTNWLNNGNPFITNSTSGTFTIYYANRENTTRLTPNKSYTFYILCKDASSGLDTGQQISGTTYQIAQVTAANNFNHGNSDTITITNPSGAGMSLSMKIGNTSILSKTPSAGNNTITFTDTNLDTIYKLYGSGNSLTVTYTVSITVNGQTYTHSRTCTIYLTGDQKTSRTNISGSWKRGKLWINVSGTWRRGVMWTNVNGTWRRGI